MSKMKLNRRQLMTTAAAAGGVSAFYGPWKHNSVWAAGADKPIKIGITSDASGQYANSGASDRRGMAMAIAEFNEKGGVLGRKIETTHIDTETTPATGSRVAERMISLKSRIARELRKNGIQTVLTLPEDLSINTINKYLELKARGSI